MHYRLIVVAAALLASSTLSAQGTRTSDADPAAVVAAVERFHVAIGKGDSTAVASLLTDDATVLESGDIESRADYFAHHFQADAEFAKAVASKRQVKRVTVLGDVAWLTASSTSDGTFEGREVHSEGAELMVLRRTATGWRIAAIHWSSHRARGR
jgi:ketosteroid isomerase-like protein